MQEIEQPVRAFLDRSLTHIGSHAPNLESSGFRSPASQPRLPVCGCPGRASSGAQLVLRENVIVGDMGAAVVPPPVGSVTSKKFPATGVDFFQRPKATSTDAT